jgi:hypothetical protein
MSDVFISYARSTEQQGQAVAEALKALGYSGWIRQQVHDDLVRRVESVMNHEARAAAGSDQRVH